MFLWKNLDAGVTLRALAVLLRRPVAPEEAAAPAASAANRNAKTGEPARAT
jgi:hypothetical protein